ncbi:CD164 sialomucin-like 2 protein isoform X3 [Peromyscus californicus insignis]|uniref:CD164 sialomucin-like 2 protein isoform X3 n=1 Tax=Peromyscus californicus insignis TaxID=564181 RepID=UPI0022A6EC01|nr:CD164 sialomucin-like 2 protein isoform X3 [Peromyscus californicus insignis]
MTAGPSRASGPAEMLTLRRVTPSHRSSTRTLGEAHANAESANPESQLRPPDPEQRQAAFHPPGAPAPCVSSQTLGTCGRTPLLTAQDRARPGRGEPPLRSWQSKVCADPKKPPRPRETRLILAPTGDCQEALGPLSALALYVLAVNGMFGQWRTAGKHRLSEKGVEQGAKVVVDESGI